MPAASATDVSRPRGLLGRIANQPYLLLTLCMLFWSGNYVAARSVADHIPPIALAQMRWGVAFAVLIAFAWPHVRRDWPVLRASWRYTALMGVLSIGVYNTFIYIGVSTTPVVNAALLASTFPIVIAAAGYVVYRDRLTLPQAAGIASASAGALVVLSNGDLSALASFRFNPGDLWILVAQWVWAFYTVLLRDRPKLHPMSFLVATVFFGQLAMLPFTAWEAASGARVPLDLTTLWVVLYVSLVASVLAFLCFNRAVAIIGSNRSGPFFHLVPVFGSVLAVLLLGETVALYRATGWALILAGIAIAQLGRRTGATRPPPPSAPTP